MIPPDSETVKKDISEPRMRGDDPILPRSGVMIWM